MKREELDNTTRMSLFEAARWTLSSFNNQPWGSIYAKRNSHNIIVTLVSLQIYLVKRILLVQ
jgi:hypothetical protein